MSIANWPTQERPRERLLSSGAGSLSNTELLAICLASGIGGKSAMDLARELLSAYGSLSQLFAASFKSVSKHSGVGPCKYVLLQAAMELCHRQMLEHLQSRDMLTSSTATRSYLKARFRHYRQEVFSCIFLNSQNHVVKLEELFNGTIDSAAVYPREVVKRCLYHNAAAVIFAHNHPSGVAEPSQADIAITRRLKNALDTVDIRVLDHFVIGEAEVVSFAERGLL